MNYDREFSFWHRLSQDLLDPKDVARIIEPTLADALCERDSAQSGHAWLWRSRVALLTAILAVLIGNVYSRLRQASWQSYLLLLVAGLSGAVILGRDGTRHFALSHILFLGIAAGLGAAVVAVPRKLLRHLGTVAIIGCFAGLAVCPWWGEVHDGRRQWLSFWALQVHIAVLALPAFVAFVNRCTETRKHGWLAIGVVTTLALVILENNVEATVVYSATVGAALLGLRGKLLSWLLTAVLVLSAVNAVVANPHWTAWFWLGTTALVLALLRAMHSASSSTNRLTQQSLIVAMVALSALRGFGNDTLPLVGFGGSAIVAFFVLVSMLMREQARVTAD